MKHCLKITILLAFLLLPLASFAQVPSSIDGVDINMNPEIPAPGQKVTVSVESFSTDLNAAAIIWSVDNKVVEKGTGKLSITVTAPQVGKTSVILVAIKTVEGKEVKKSVTIKPGGVDLVWESDGFSPPLYDGKTQFAYENPVRINAIPHIAGSNGTELDPRTLVYRWTLNDQVDLDQSGYGKQTLKVQTPVPRPLDIKVEVGTADGRSKASGSISLTPTDPSILFYEDSPLYGVLYNKALQNTIRLENQEISIRAVPFSFNVSNAKPLTYNWSVNNLERGDLSKNESITLRTKGDVEGTSAISLEIRNAINILQGAENAVSVQFSKKKAADTAVTF